MFEFIQKLYEVENSIQPENEILAYFVAYNYKRFYLINYFNI